MSDDPRLILGILTLAVALHTPAFAQEDEGPPVAPASPESTFRVYCANCHGEAGRGDGVLAFGLSKPALDLTRISARNGGSFPRERIVRIIDGREETSAHGEREMPVWGDWFELEATSQVGADKDPAAIKKRIDGLVDFLESIQE
jgi:mono/diheme cytochrome c family protein